MNIDWSKGPYGAVSLAYSRKSSYARFRNSAGYYWENKDWRTSLYDDWQTIATRPQEQDNNMPELLEGDLITWSDGQSAFYDPMEKVKGLGGVVVNTILDNVTSVHRSGELVWGNTVKKQAEDVWRKHNKGVSGSEARDLIEVLYDAGMLKEPE